DAEPRHQPAIYGRLLEDFDGRDVVKDVVEQLRQIHHDVRLEAARVAWREQAALAFQLTERVEVGRADVDLGGFQLPADGPADSALRKGDPERTRLRRIECERLRPSPRIVVGGWSGFHLRRRRHASAPAQRRMAIEDGSGTMTSDNREPD